MELTNKHVRLQKPPFPTLVHKSCHQVSITNIGHHGLFGLPYSPPFLQPFLYFSLLQPYSNMAVEFLKMFYANIRRKIQTERKKIACQQN